MNRSPPSSQLQMPPLVQQLIDSFDDAVVRGRCATVKAMLDRYGVPVVGGVTRGARALRLAATCEHVEVMRILLQHGVEHTGPALGWSIVHANTTCIEFLMKRTPFVDESSGPTLAVCTILSYRYNFSLKLFRWLLDAGARTDIPVTVMSSSTVLHRGTARECVENCYKTASDKDSKSTPCLRINAIRHLLLREEAVHAVSWQYPARTLKASNPIPTLRHIKLVRRSRASTSGVALLALRRYTSKVV